MGKHESPHLRLLGCNGSNITFSLYSFNCLYWFRNAHGRGKAAEAPFLLATVTTTELLPASFQKFEPLRESKILSFTSCVAKGHVQCTRTVYAVARDAKTWEICVSTSYRACKLQMPRSYYFVRV